MIIGYSFFQSIVMLPVPDIHTGVSRRQEQRQQKQQQQKQDLPHDISLCTTFFIWWPKGVLYTIPPQKSNGITKIFSYFFRNFLLFTVRFQVSISGKITFRWNIRFFSGKGLIFRLKLLHYAFESILNR